MGRVKTTDACNADERFPGAMEKLRGNVSGGRIAGGRIPT